MCVLPRNPFQGVPGTCYLLLFFPPYLTPTPLYLANASVLPQQCTPKLASVTAASPHSVIPGFTLVPFLEHALSASDTTISARFLPLFTDVDVHPHTHVL